MLTEKVPHDLGQQFDFLMRRFYAAAYETRPTARAERIFIGEIEFLIKFKL